MLIPSEPRGFGHLARVHTGPQLGRHGDGMEGTQAGGFQSHNVETERSCTCLAAKGHRFRGARQTPPATHGEHRFSTQSATGRPFLSGLVVTLVVNLTTRARMWPAALWISTRCRHRLQLRPRVAPRAESAGLRGDGRFEVCSGTGETRSWPVAARAEHFCRPVLRTRSFGLTRRPPV